ncbi:MAG: hypothetical protein MJZ72_01475 [Bacteroidales bacterium]|nr:hypothetical protein [Bacteroidales bacterium]
MAKLKFDSTSTTKGFLFQFLVALEKCFEMEEGQSVYIETYGDVSLLGDLSKSEQIESKFYKKSLTDLDKNVWNTIHNWMSDEFPIDKFSSLVLFTTQKISKGSAWENWNNKTFAERQKVLAEIKSKFDTREKQSKELKKCMEVIFDAKNTGKLSKIIRMLCLDCNNPNWDIYQNRIFERYGKGVPKMQKKHFIDSLFGYIVRPEIVDKNWEISYELFTKEVNEVTAQLVENTTIFPAKLKLDDIKHEDYEENKFVQKIQDIEYDEVIPYAIDDYVHTVKLIADEMNESEVIKNSLLQYEDNIENNFKTKYRKASRNYKEDERIEKSQDFYDDITSSSDGTFHSYNSIPSYFHNGMVHILTEDRDDLVWLLKEKTNG